MAVTFTNVEYLTKEILMNLDAKKVIAQYAENKSLEGQLKQQGDTVSVRLLPDVEWVAGGTAGADITESNFTITKESLTISDTFQINQRIDDIEEVQYNRNLQSDVAMRIAEGQAIKQDKYVATMVKDAVSANKFNETTPLAISASNSLTTVEELRVALENQNVNVNGTDVGLFLDPRFCSFLRQGNWLSNTEKGAGINIDGYLGRCSGMNIYQTTLLPNVVNLTMDTIPTAGNTMTINGITWTFVASGTAANPGEISIGANVAAAQANTVLAINGTGTPGATTYIDVSAANRTILKNIDISMTSFTSNVASIYANTTITVSETFTPATDVFGTVAKIGFAICKGAIHTAYQLNKMKVTDAPLGFRSNLLGEMVAGRKVFTQNAKRIATTRYY